MPFINQPKQLNDQQLGIADQMKSAFGGVQQPADSGPSLWDKLIGLFSGGVASQGNDPQLPQGQPILNQSSQPDPNSPLAQQLGNAFSNPQQKR